MTKRTKAEPQPIYGDTALGLFSKIDDDIIVCQHDTVLKLTKGFEYKFKKIARDSSKTEENIQLCYRLAEGLSHFYTLEFVLFRLGQHFDEVIEEEELEKRIEVYRDKSLYERFQSIGDEARSHPETICSYILGTIPEVGKLLDKERKSIKQGSVPERAPALWTKHRIENESPAHFICRNYSLYMGKGLNKGHIKKLDPTLYVALHRWEQDPKKVVPDYYVLPGRKELAAENKSTWVDRQEKSKTERQR